MYSEYRKQRKRLASLHGVPVDKAEQAALFHDIAKFMEPTEMRKMIENSEEDKKLLSFHHELWHAAVGRIHSGGRIWR